MTLLWLYCLQHPVHTTTMLDIDYLLHTDHSVSSDEQSHQKHKIWWHQHFNHIRSVRQLIIKLRENLQLTDLHYQLSIPLLLKLLMTTMNISVQIILMTLLKTLRQLLLTIRKSLSVNNYSYNVYNKKLSMKTIRGSSESSIYALRKTLNSLS